MNLSRLMLLLGLSTVLASMACDPCRSLAEKICECEETSAARENCLRSLDLFPHMNSFEAARDPEVCQEILKSENCNCKAIQDGLTEKCGMTR